MLCVNSVNAPKESKEPNFQIRSIVTERAKRGIQLSIDCRSHMNLLHCENKMIIISITYKYIQISSFTSFDDALFFFFFFLLSSVSFVRLHCYCWYWKITTTKKLKNNIEVLHWDICIIFVVWIHSFGMHKPHIVHIYICEWKEHKL